MGGSGADDKRGAGDCSSSILTSFGPPPPPLDDELAPPRPSPLENEGDFDIPSI